MSTFFNRKTHCIKVVFAVFLSLVFINACAVADQNAETVKDKTIQFTLDDNNCVSKLDTGSYSNCDVEFGTSDNPCKNKKKGECICSKKGKSVKWEFAENKQKQDFKIVFVDSKSPVAGCDLDSKNGGPINCQITADVTQPTTYTYSIKIEACETTYDPIIIIDK